MKSLPQKPRKTRNENGHAISEFGAAIWLLVLGFLFPCISILSLFVSYACCFVLNQNQAEEAALLNSNQSGGSNLICNQLPSQWQDSGIGSFSRVQAMPQTQISYQSLSPNAGTMGSQATPRSMVTVSTSFTIKPLIQVPAFGLDQPIQFIISTQRTAEDPNA